MSKRIFPKVLLLVVAVFGLLVFSNVLSAQGLSQEAFERVKEVQERHTDHLLGIKGVEGTAIGFNRNNRPALKVFVARWDVAGIPKKLDDVPVQVVVTGKFYALPKPEPSDTVDPTIRFERPVPIGVSTGHPNITAGTIGCRVYEDIDEDSTRDDNERVFALSNNHVYADCNEANVEDNVLQPGAYDGGVDPDDAIGTLEAFQVIDFEGDDNTIDAAIATSSTELLGNATPSDGYGTPSSAIAPAYVGLEVQKYGRTTGLTKGKVSGLNAIVNVYYGDVDGDGVDDVARFVQQIIITPTKGRFSAGGDSGSLIVTEEGKNPIGLLFAGGGRWTIANPIDAVLDTLGLIIDVPLTIDDSD